MQTTEQTYEEHVLQRRALSFNYISLGLGRGQLSFKLINLFENPSWICSGSSPYPVWFFTQVFQARRCPFMLPFWFLLPMPQFCLVIWFMLLMFLPPPTPSWILCICPAEEFPFIIYCRPNARNLCKIRLPSPSCQKQLPSGTLDLDYPPVGRHQGPRLPSQPRLHPKGCPEGHPLKLAYYAFVIDSSPPPFHVQAGCSWGDCKADSSWLLRDCSGIKSLQ